MANYQDEYGQQYSGPSMEESVSPMYSASVQQQQYPTQGSYYSPPDPQHNSEMYSQGQGVLIDFFCSPEKVTISTLH